MIPLSVPNISAPEQEKVAAALAANWISTVGPQVKEFEQALRDLTGSPFVIPTNSGTSALHLALLVHGIGPDHLVLAPNITYVATLNPIRYVGAEPVLIDVDAGTGQMSATLTEEFLARETETWNGQRIHRQTKRRVGAIVVTHILGYPAEIAEFQAIAERYQLPLIEDAAEAVGSRVQGQHLGTFGTAGILSFNGNKIMSTGSGGALLLKDPAQAEHARSLAHQAKRHLDEYVHDEIGYNYGLSNVQAALGLGQLERLDEFVARKRAVMAHYKNSFADIGEIQFLDGVAETGANHWLATIFSPMSRILEEVLGVQGIQTRKLWVPMNRLPMFRDCIYRHWGDQSQRIYEHSLSLPCSTGITDEQLETVSRAVQSFFSN